MKTLIAVLALLFLAGCGCEPGTEIHGCEDMYTTGGIVFLPMLGVLFLIVVAMMFLTNKKRITRTEYERRRRVLGLERREK